MMTCSTIEPGSSRVRARRISIRPSPAGDLRDTQFMTKRRVPHRLKSSACESAAVVYGVTWYTESQWSSIKAAATDPERFESSYREWVAMAEGALQELARAGVRAEKFFVEANDLLAWCLAHNKPNDGASRADFVSEQMRSLQKPRTSKLDP
jgi:hypothetical protein